MIEIILNKKNEHTIEDFEQELVYDKNDVKQIEDLKSEIKVKTTNLVKISKKIRHTNQIIQLIKHKIEDSGNGIENYNNLFKEILILLKQVDTSSTTSFEIQLDELHKDFIIKLKDKHPELTLHDIRLATYIKIGLDSKEISKLLKIKPSSVYISRSRLRKKINLKSDTDLHFYMNNI